MHAGVGLLVVATGSLMLVNMADPPFPQFYLLLTKEAFFLTNSTVLEDYPVLGTGLPYVTIVLLARTFLTVVLGHTLVLLASFTVLNVVDDFVTKISNQDCLQV